MFTYAFMKLLERRPGSYDRQMDWVSRGRVRAIKVSLPRAYSSGSAPDTDVYGCQQHFPLAEIEV